MKLTALSLMCLLLTGCISAYQEGGAVRVPVIGVTKQIGNEKATIKWVKESPDRPPGTRTWITDRPGFYGYVNTPFK